MKDNNYSQKWILANPTLESDNSCDEYDFGDFPGSMVLIGFDESEYDNDYTQYSHHEIELGDEISASCAGQYGIVVGIITDFRGAPVCYKVIREEYDSDENGCEGTLVRSSFDYIQASLVSEHESCGNTEWSLGRIGYQWIGDEKFASRGYFYNKETEDLANW